MPDLYHYQVNISAYLLSAFGFLYSHAYAQNQSSVWALGDSILLEIGSSGFEFSRYIPFYAQEGVTSICDTGGNLLFYASNTTAYNRNDDSLLNGHSLAPGSNTVVQGCMAVPIPSDPHRFYFMSLGYESSDEAYLYASIIDLTLDGGKGGVVPGMKAIRLSDRKLGEQLHIVRHGNGVDWWVLVRPVRPDSVGRTQGFMLFKLTNDSILGPYLQDIGQSSGVVLGELTASPDGSKLVLSSFNSNLIQVFNFDRCTGIISEDALIYDPLGGGYFGVAFGPDSKNIYGVRGEVRIVNQFFKTEDGYGINEIMRYGAVIGRTLSTPESGPDGRIYIASADRGAGPDTTTYYLGVVRDPTQEGLACMYDTFGVWLGGASNQSIAIPNQPNYELGVLEGSPCDPSVSSMSTLIGTSETWSVFPNPLQERICVQSTTGSHPDKLALFDVAGRLVWEEEVFDSFGGATYCYDVPASLAPGSYSLRIQWGKMAHMRHVEVAGR
jgi:hypothetical protein